MFSHTFFVRNGIEFSWWLNSGIKSGSCEWWCIIFFKSSVNVNMYMLEHPFVTAIIDIVRQWSDPSRFKYKRYYLFRGRNNFNVPKELHEKCIVQEIKLLHARIYLWLARFLLCTSVVMTRGSKRGKKTYWKKAHVKYGSPLVCIIWNGLFVGFRISDRISDKPNGS